MNNHSSDCLCFPCRRERKRLADLEWAESHADLKAALPSPKKEARALLALVQRRNGGTKRAIEEVRQLIEVPPRIKAFLLAYARRHPEEGKGIRRVLKFRQRVAAEFERLLGSGRQLPQLRPTHLTTVRAKS
jgi:hypothetical protein